MAEGKPIPTELRNEEAELRHQIELEDDNTAGMVFNFFFFMFGYRENVIEIEEKLGLEIYVVWLLRKGE